MSADMLLPYFTEEDQLKSGVCLLSNEKRKQEMLRAIEFLRSKFNFTVITNLGPLVLFLFDNADSDENANNTLSIAVSVMNDLYSTVSDKIITNVFGDEVTEDNVLDDLYKLFFVILTPWFTILRNEFNSKIFSKFKLSSGSDSDFASNLAAKLLLYFDEANIQQARDFLTGKYGNAKTFKWSELNNDVKNAIVTVKESIYNINMDMVKTLPEFIAIHNALLQQYKTAEDVMRVESENFSLDIFEYRANFSRRQKRDVLPYVQSRKKCTTCTEKDEFMAYFYQVAINIYYMFSAIDVYNKQNDRDYAPSSLEDHRFQLFDTPPDCNCVSLDRLKFVNAQVGKYILDLQIRPINIDVDHLQSTEALAYIMKNIVMPNNQLRQTAEKRVFKITREIWLEFLNTIEQTVPNDNISNNPVYDAASSANNAFEISVPSSDYDEAQFVAMEMD